MRKKTKSSHEKANENTFDFFNSLGLAQSVDRASTYTSVNAHDFPESEEAARWKVVSLFSGCGGLDLGFKQVGFDIIYACDNDPAAVRCYNFNFDSKALIRDVNDHEFIEDLKRIGSSDVVLGGFPCQGFSKAGPKNEHDSRNALYLKMREAIRILSPRIFIAENVDGIEQNFNGQFVSKIKEAFRFPAAEYDVDFRIIDAQAYGAPQHRRRAFFVGRRKPIHQQFLWPRPTHIQRNRSGEFRISESGEAVGTRPPRTIEDAIKDLVSLKTPVADHKVTNDWPAKYSHIFAKIGPGQKLCNVRHSASSVYTWEIPEVFSEISERQRSILETISRNRRHKRYGSIPNGNPLPMSEISILSGLSEIEWDVKELQEKGYLKPVNDGFDLKGAMFCSGLFKRPVWGEPSPTVLTNFHNPRYFLHPSENRPFSLRECARLQTFPDPFLFEGAGVSLVDGYRLVGNAVAPVVSKAFAVSVLEYLGNVEPMANPVSYSSKSA